MGNGPTPHDWPEDWPHDNGMYLHKCACGEGFIGHKRRPRCKVCTEGGEAATIGPMALSNKEKQEAFRARQAMQGLTEVRGIFLPPELHAKLKERAEKLRREWKPKVEPDQK